MKKESIPLYGVIPFFGGEWTVTFKKVRDGKAWHSSRLSGYGAFPFERFPNIPVIDYTNNDSVMDVLSWNTYIEESTIITEYSSVIPLKNYLARVFDLGIKIHNYER